MSRSLAGTQVPSFSPISTRPPSSGSSPASMRSAVVLPDPDGPTRTMNSPSLMSRSRASTAGGASLAYTRLADTNFTPAMGDLRLVRHQMRGRSRASLDCSHGEAADQRALGDPAHEDHGDRGNRCRRGQVREVQPLLGDGADDA